MARTTTKVRKALKIHVIPGKSIEYGVLCGQSDTEDPKMLAKRCVDGTYESCYDGKPIPTSQICGRCLTGA